MHKAYGLLFLLPLLAGVPHQAARQGRLPLAFVCPANRKEPRLIRSEIYQYENSDTTKQGLTLTRRFNNQGRVIAEEMMNFRKAPEYGKERGSASFHYRDTMLVEEVYIDKRNDQTKTRYGHDCNGRLTQEERFTYQRRRKPNVDKGWGRPGGCILTDADYQKHRTWEKTSVIHYAYDAQGRRIAYDAPDLHYSSQNRYTWAYDSLGRVSRYISYDQQRIIWIEDYHYFAGGYRSTRTWFEADGQAAHLKSPNKGYWPQYSTTYYFNAAGKMARQETASEKGVIVSREARSYDGRGQIVRMVQSAEGRATLIHRYVYYYQ